jgi:hypothetical protein
MESIKIPSLIIFNGVPNSGKSYLMKYLVYMLATKRELDFVIVFSPSKFNGCWDCIDQEYVFSMYDEETLMRLLEIQQTEKKKTLVIFDDCIGSADFNKKFFTSFIATYRHYNIGVWISTQNVCKVPPIVRDSCTHSVIFECYAKTQLEGLYNSYGIHFETIKKWKDYIVNNCKNHQFILYTKKPNGEPVYQVLKAPPKVPKFRLT